MCVWGKRGCFEDGPVFGVVVAVLGQRLFPPADYAVDVVARNLGRGTCSTLADPDQLSALRVC